MRNSVRLLLRRENRQNIKLARVVRTVMGATKSDHTLRFVTTAGGATDYMRRIYLDASAHPADVPSNLRALSGRCLEPAHDGHSASGIQRGFPRGGHQHSSASAPAILAANRKDSLSAGPNE